MSGAARHSKAPCTFKTCGCGAEYTHEQWVALVFKGIQRVDPEWPELELRDCKCGSTIAIEIEKRSEP